MTRESWSPTNIWLASAIASNANKKIPARLLKKRLPKRLKTTKTKTNETAETAQERYNKYFDKSVCAEQKLQTRRLRPVHVPAVHISTANDLSQETPEKLQPRYNRPFKVTFVNPRTITLDENGIGRTVYIFRGSLAKCRDKVVQTAPVAQHGSDNNTV